MLVTGMPHLYIEGIHTKAVRLTDIRVCEGIVYLELQELKSTRSFTVNWNLGYKGSSYLWSIADLPTLSKQTE